METERCEVGEAPHWDAKTKSLYFVDIPRAEILRYDSSKNKIYKAKIKDNQLPVSFIIPIENSKDEFVVSTGLKVCVIRWNGKSEVAEIVENLTQVDHDRKENRCNDAKVDPHGLLYFGTMGNDEKYDLSVRRVGSLYRYSDESGTKFLLGDIGISNGMAWDVKRRKFFYIDSMTRDIKQFKYEPVYGEICEYSLSFSSSCVCINSLSLFETHRSTAKETRLVDFNRTHRYIDFIADGMTIDRKGNLYVAAFGASRILVVDPKAGKIVHEIDMPTRQVTSLAFGGRKLQTLYVTTADKDRTRQGSAGGLFKITGLGVRGLPMNKFKRNR